jgi:hypothetical protein
MLKEQADRKFAKKIKKMYRKAVYERADNDTKDYIQKLEQANDTLRLRPSPMKTALFVLLGEVAIAGIIFMLAIAGR